jgi:hypothetical protein
MIGYRVIEKTPSSASGHLLPPVGEKDRMRKNGTFIERGFDKKHKRQNLL